MSNLTLINTVDSVGEEDLKSMYQVKLPNGNTHGYMLESTVLILLPLDGIAVCEREKHVLVKGAFNSDEIEEEAITRNLQGVVDTARATEKFSEILGKHSERYRILGTSYSNPITFERFATPIFGFAAGGVYLMAYVKGTDGISLWISRRGPAVLNPDKLDVTAAGGLQAGHTPLEAILDEAKEEASFSRELVIDNAKAIDPITYWTKRAKMPYFAIQYGYEMLLGKEIKPKPDDLGEVAEFKLMHVKDVVAAMINGEFREACNLCIVDFLIRHKIITPENEPQYDELGTRLRRQLPVPT